MVGLLLTSQHTQSLGTRGPTAYAEATLKITRLAKQVRLAIRKTPQEAPVHAGAYVSTGCTLLNLALTDHPRLGYRAGSYYFLVGDSTSGKTFFSMTCMAEAVRNPAFKNYRMIYDNIEDGMLMDVKRLFGQGVVDRLEPPARDKGEPVFSSTIEEFYYHIDDALRAGKPFIYVLDSMDGLSSDAEEDKFNQQKAAHRAGKEVAGSYGDGKAKKNSAGLRKVLRGLRDTGSILIIISQTRDVLNAMPFQEKKTRSGGRALRFYATCEIWTELSGSLSKTVRGKARKIGNEITIKIKKNRHTGKLHEVQTAIFPSYGVDDLGSLVDYLVEEKRWPKDGSKINPRDLGMEPLGREALVKHLDENPLAHSKLVGWARETWALVAKETALDRTPRYN